MAKVRDSELRAILRLCGEVAEIRHPLERADHFLRTGQSLIGADVLGILGATEGDGLYELSAGFVVGLENTRTQQVQNWYLDQQEYRNDPLNRALHVQKGKALTRREMISDSDWYADPHIADGWRSVGLDDCLVTVSPASRRRALIFGMRSWGGSGFSGAQTAMLDALAEGFQWLLRLLEQEGYLGENPKAVPTRLEGVLSLLLRGHSERDIADRLSLSERTVHKYVEQLYRHFGVRSRPALMAQWIPSASPLSLQMLSRP